MSGRRQASVGKGVLLTPDSLPPFEQRGKTTGECTECIRLSPLAHCGEPTPSRRGRCSPSPATID